MNATYTAITKQDKGWWIGWIEEVPGVNAQELTKPALMNSLREILAELELNCGRRKAIFSNSKNRLEKPQL